ncbi:MAG: hypothetical protein LBT76_03360, partial [Tannerella sp.]|nr:hypothetical protein [Tannerella sp.]
MEKNEQKQTRLHLFASCQTSRGIFSYFTRDGFVHCTCPVGDEMPVENRRFQNPAESRPGGYAGHITCHPCGIRAGGSHPIFYRHPVPNGTGAMHKSMPREVYQLVPLQNKGTELIADVVFLQLDRERVESYCQLDTYDDIAN